MKCACGFCVRCTREERGMSEATDRLVVLRDPHAGWNRVELFVNHATGRLAVYFEDNDCDIPQGTHDLTQEQTRQIAAMCARVLGSGNGGSE